MVARAELQPFLWVFGEVGIEGWAAVDTMVVVGDDILKGGKLPIVHVGRGAADVAQTGRGKFAPIILNAGDRKPSDVLARLKAIVMKLVIAE